MYGYKHGYAGFGGISHDLVGSVRDMAANLVRSALNWPTVKGSDLLRYTGQYMENIATNVATLNDEVSKLSTEQRTALSATGFDTVYGDAVNAFNRMLTNEIAPIVSLLASGTGDRFSRVDEMLEGLVALLGENNERLNAANKLLVSVTGKPTPGWDKDPTPGPAPGGGWGWLWWVALGFGGYWAYKHFFSTEYPRHKLPGYAK